MSCSWRQARREAEDYGQTGFARWFRGVAVLAEYEFGDWDAAPARPRTPSSPRSKPARRTTWLAECYICRALVRLGRGDGRGCVARRRARHSSTLRRAKDPQAVSPSVPGGARLHRARRAGQGPRAGGGVPRRLGGGKSAWLRGSRPCSALLDADTAVGRGEELASALERYAPDPLGAGSALAFANGDPVGAADSLRRDRRRSPRRPTAASPPPGRGDLRQLEPALAFYRSVRATGYVREGESLLAASA